MGSLLDTSVVVRAERSQWTEVQLLDRIYEQIGEQHIGLSTVAATELLHGIYRAADPGIRRRRETFLEQLFEDIPIYAYTLQVARVAGEISGQEGARGFHIPFADLAIGATAVTLGFSVLTANARHFRLIPHLEVIDF